MNTKDLSGTAIVIRMKLLNIVGKQITTLTGIRRKLLIGKAGNCNCKGSSDVNEILLEALLEFFWWYFSHDLWLNELFHLTWQPEWSDIVLNLVKSKTVLSKAVLVCKQDIRNMLFWKELYVLLLKLSTKTEQHFLLLQKCLVEFWCNFH